MLNVKKFIPGKPKDLFIERRFISETPSTESFAQRTFWHRKQIQSWRLAFFVMVIFAIGELLFSIVLATRNSTEAVVYRESDKHDISLMAGAHRTNKPTDLAIEHAITQWLRAIRDIPGDDPDLINRNADDVLSVIQSGSPAFQSYVAQLHVENPKELAHNGVHRTVVGKPEITQLSALTYRIAWKENVVNQNLTNASLLGVNAYSGQITLASPPSVPSDIFVAIKNPLGIFIKTYDLRAGVLTK